MASRFDFARRPGSLGSGREGSMFNLGSRQQNLAHPEAPSTLYSSDTSARGQQSWYQSPPQADYRSPAANGIASSSSLCSSVLHQPFESPSYNDITATPFQPFDMPESMQDIVRGFETGPPRASSSSSKRRLRTRCSIREPNNTNDSRFLHHPPSHRMLMLHPVCK